MLGQIWAFLSISTNIDRSNNQNDVIVNVHYHYYNVKCVLYYR